MTAQELQVDLMSSAPPVLLHVLPPEVFAAERLVGSRNACVYETAFLDQVREQVADPATRVVVYGAGAGSLDAVTAAEKLRGAGYANVEVFDGGMAEWRAAGLPIEGDGNFPQPPIADGNFQVDTAASLIRWTGRNLFNHHSGTVQLSGGEIRVRDGDLVAARFTIAMTTIANEDIPDSAMNAMLIRHLHDADFFDVAQHPVAEFVAESAEAIPNSTEGTPNYVLRGTITVRGISRTLDLPVVVAAKDERHLVGQGQFELDRTQFGSRYGSGKFFRFLGQHVVNDHVHLHVKIHAESVG